MNTVQRGRVGNSLLSAVVVSVSLGLIAPAAVGAGPKPETGGKVPSGFSIVGETPDSPHGYSLAGFIDLGTDRWRSDVGGITPRGYLSGAAALNQCVFAIGGSEGTTIVTGLENFLRYSSFETVWRHTASMPTSRNNLTAETVNNKVYAIGGSSIAAGSALAAVEEFDPVTLTWVPKAPMPTARFALASAVLDGTIYAIGGVMGCCTGTAAVEQYNPGTDTWISKAPLPTPRRSLAAAAVNGKIYAIGGTVTEGTQDARVEEYDPATNSWKTKSSMPTPRRGARAAVVQNRIYVIGGYREGVGVVNTLEVYDPATDSWASRPPMPMARQFPGVAVLGNSIFVVAGSLGASDTGVVEVYEPRVRYYLHRKD